MPFSTALKYLVPNLPSIYLHTLNSATWNIPVHSRCTQASLDPKIFISDPKIFIRDSKLQSQFRGIAQNCVEVYRGRNCAQIKSTCVGNTTPSDTEIFVGDPGFSSETSSLR